MPVTTPRFAPLALPLVVAVLALVGCGSDPPTVLPTLDAGDTTNPDGSGGDAGADSGETPDGDAPDPNRCPLFDGAFGDTCTEDADCSSLVCLKEDGQETGFCSQLCRDLCPSLCSGEPTFCRSDRADESVVRFVCQRAPNTLCSPCESDAQCNGGRCLFLDDGTRSCGTDCSIDADCPSGYTCGGLDPNLAGQCIPFSGTCSCTEANDGLIRPCENRNTFGVCAGQQTCDASAGWSLCDASLPAAETCNGRDDNCDGIRDNGAEIGGECPLSNEFGTCPGLLLCTGEAGYVCTGRGAEAETCDGIDNNCDGRVDEDFTDDAGRYVTEDHCGACGVQCAGRFAFATSISCDTDRDVPACVIDGCEPGYVQASETSCIPVQTNICQPCVEDGDCSASSPGAACVTIIDQTQPTNVARVCGRDCSPESAFGEGCPDGYACEATLDASGAAVTQCVPLGGTCSCIGNPDGFAVSCAVTITGEVSLDGDIGEVTCTGARACVATGGFGACALPTDVCDGFDNDCSGRIDDDFRDPAGRYTTDAHCGRCGNDCRLRFTPERDNAEGRCMLDGETPVCTMVCIDDERGTWRDVFNGTDDGCECRVQSATDVPDLNPSACEGSCDQNCDGVDGDVGRAIFVSKIGVDANGRGGREAPLATIGAALARAAACRSGTAGIYCPPDGVRDVYVATGVYSENITLQNGISLYGGYSLDFFQRDPATNPTTIFGVAPTGAQRGTVTATGINQPTVVSGFSIYGFSPTTAGASTYTVWIRDATDALHLERNRVYAANGASGSTGSPGASGASGGNGLNGTNAITSSSRACGSPSLPGGAGATSTCGAAGGVGGNANCPQARTATGAECNSTSVANVNACLNQCPGPAACTPLPPPQGVGAAGGGNAGCVGPTCGQPGSPTYDHWSDANVCTRCGSNTGLPKLGQDGQPGRVGSNGTAGTGCSGNGGTIDGNGLFVANAGAGGANNATSGGGGGGGSAGAGFDIVSSTPGSGAQCNDRIGGSGGGGGAGGCPGQPGTGGTGGGASFAIFISFSSSAATTMPRLTDNTIFRGRGGDGGRGGTGGAGGLGGLGGLGGNAFPNTAFCTLPGGAGGSGGIGGAGAGGGGGCGGNAWGIFVFRNGSTLAGVTAASIRSANTLPATGAGGRGGPGGVSPVPGSNGQNGSAGTTIDVEVR